MVKITPFKSSDYLKTEEDIKAYNDALDDEGVVDMTNIPIHFPQRGVIDDDDEEITSACCGEPMPDWPDSDFCPACREHSGPMDE